MLMRRDAVQTSSGLNHRQLPATWKRFGRESPNEGWNSGRERERERERERARDGGSVTERGREQGEKEREIVWYIWRCRYQSAQHCLL